MDNYNEGKLKEIADLVIKPLVPMKPKNMSFKRWLERIFHIDTREIWKCRAERGFSMLGLYVAAPRVKIQGIGHRKIKHNTLMWIRFDSTEPNKIEIEVQADKGKKTEMFELNQEEWRKTEPYIKKLKQ